MKASDIIGRYTPDEGMLSVETRPRDSLELSWATPAAQQISGNIKETLSSAINAIAEWHLSGDTGALIFELSSERGYVILGAEVKKGMVTVEKLGQEEEPEDIEIY